MADKVTGQIEPSVLGGADIYQFTLDGIATSKQMDRLIDLTKDLVKKTVGEGADSLKNLNKSADNAAKSITGVEKSFESVEEATRNLRDEQNKAATLLRNVWSRNFSLALDESDKALSAFTFAVGFAYRGLTEYSKSLTEGLKRGVAGSTFDLAIAAKSAGVSLTTFTKALSESGGGFASLGTNATDGALQFGYLVKRVREATSSVGNLGFTNDELAALTAQQTKIAISQGFKGRQAQEVVIRNTRMLGQELDNLAARTGKSTLEMAQAAAKLAQDPIVSNFVRSAREGSKEISTAVQSFAASMRGVFGEKGDKIAQDALQSAMSGLPMIVTQTGKNMILASNGIYTEIERQAQKARRGEKISEEDRQRLRDMAIQEVKARGQELNQFAMLGGSVGESARALLELAQEAAFYTSEEGKRQRRQSDAAKRFNTELNELQASLQEALIPFLQALNAVDWATIFNVVSYIPRKIAEFIESFRSFVNSLPPGLVDGLGMVADFLSKLVSAGAGVLVTIGLIATAYTVYQKTLGAITTLYSGLSKELGLQNSKYGIVGKALDAFAAAINKATAAAAARKMADGMPSGGIPNAPDRRTGRRTPGVPGAAAADISESAKRTGGGLGGLAQAERDLAAKSAAERKADLARAAEIRSQNAGMTGTTPAQALRQARLERRSRPLPTAGDSFGLDRRLAERKAREEQAKQRERERVEKEKARQDKLRKERLEKAAELKKKTPGMSSAEALRQAAEAQAKREARLEPLRSRYEGARTTVIGGMDAAKGAWGKATPTLGKVGEKLASPKGIGFGMIAGIGLDMAAEAAKAGGHEKTAKALDVGSSAVGMGMTGAMIGTMIGGPVGTAVGAALGGLVGGLTSIWKNYLSDEESSMSEAVKAEKEKAESKAESEAKQLLESNRRILEELRRGNEEVSYGNQINARGVSYAASTERKIADLRFNQG